MLTADFDFPLPPELIAQFPTAQRDESRLLVVHRAEKQFAHHHFRDIIEFLRPGDVLVLNNSRVIPARMRGVNAVTGGAFEILLLEEVARNDWWAMMKPGKRARLGTRIRISDPQHPTRELEAVVTGVNDEGHRRLNFSGTENILHELETIGELPLPPYIARDAKALPPSDRERYQTVYAQTAGSVAAPTAGLHFTENLLATLRARGVETHFVTLHVGLGTFAPVKADSITDHIMHEERFTISETTAKAVNTAKSEGRRIIAVGTTSVRVLESAAPIAGEKPRITAGAGRTKIFIFPPRDFKIVDALITNFHLPCSTLLMLVSAFAAPGATHGRETILAAYAAAVRERYRFFSYGDAMLLL